MLVCVFVWQKEGTFNSPVNTISPEKEMIKFKDKDIQIFDKFWIWNLGDTKRTKDGCKSFTS